MTFEYLTTTGLSVPDRGRADPPLQPTGDGWEPFGSDVIKDGLVSDSGFAPTQTRFRHFWYWRRRLDGRPCVECGSIARSPDGSCLACPKDPD